MWVDIMYMLQIDFIMSTRLIYNTFSYMPDIFLGTFILSSVFFEQDLSNQCIKRLEYFKINQIYQSHGWYDFARE